MIHRTGFHRDNFGSLLNTFDLCGTFVEIGALYGGNAKPILRHWLGKQMFLVDPWAPQPADIYKEDQDWMKFDLGYEICKKLAEQDPRVKLIRLLSHQAVDQFDDGSLDCVYIDGNHCYEAVSQDIQLWFPKVKKGGILSGHDFYTYVDATHHTQVEAAVTEWAAEAQRDIMVGRCSSWLCFV